MKGMATINIVGTVVRDPEAHETTAGIVTRLRIAVNGRKQGDPTAFYSCAVWGKRGDAVRQYVGKGDSLAVTGRLSLSEYESQGEKRTGLDVDVHDFAFIGNGAGGPKSAAQPQQTNKYQPVTDDEIPF